MGILYTDPFLFRLPDLLLVFVGDVGLLIVDGVSDIGLILQDGFYDCYGPGIALLLRSTFIDVGELSVLLIQQISGCRYFLLDQCLCDLCEYQSCS